MWREFKNNPYFRFTFLAIILYVIWYVIYEAWLHPSGLWDRLIINNLVYLSDGLLHILGYDTLPAADPNSTIRIVGIDGTSGVWIGDPCNGFSLFALFVIFMITYPGPWKQKWWFTLVGIVIIHLVNVLRITALAILVKVNPDWLYFNHNYTFTIIVYSVVFLLWWIWAKKFAAHWLKQIELVANAKV
jgi:exosortase family protein XrtF